MSVDAPEPVSTRRLNRATLARQMLLQRHTLDPTQAIGQLLGVQAQFAPSPYIALWNRLRDFEAASLDAAFAAYRVVKAKTVRGTLHAHHAEDYPILRAARQPAGHGNGLTSRVTAAGVAEGTAASLVSDIRSFLVSPRTSAEIMAAIAEQVGPDVARDVWHSLQGSIPLLHAPTGQTWSFGQRPAFVVTPIAAELIGPETSDEAVATLLRRYLTAFGPASIADVAQFTGMTRTALKQALAVLEDELVVLVGPAGEQLVDEPSAPRPDDDIEAPPRLLPMWDSTLLAYHDRSRIIPATYRRHVIRQNGDVLPTILVDGYVAGVWRAVGGGIEVTAFHRLAAQTWQQLAAEAASLADFLAQRDPAVYRRFDHWWNALPGTEVRMLAAR